ncbi:MAG: TIGR02996 domain-containing protein [Gemmataceae bacterium]|nr:TIGR02996 domain-containing protein [Gemmataceae bacterium]
MPTDDAILCAIADEPRVELHRLVHADWLDDHGQPDRAELVRAQVELEKLPPASDRALELRRRAEDLLAEHEAGWMGEWAERLVRWEWRGGYVHSATVEADAWAKHGADLMRAFPLHQLAFVDREGGPVPPEAIEGVVRQPAFRAVRSLDTEAGGEESFHSNPPRVRAGREWARRLAAAPEAGGLEELLFSGYGEDNGTRFPMADLAAAPHLARLRSLRIEAEPGFGDDELDILAWCPTAYSLRDLRLPFTALSAQSVVELASAPRFSGLRRLDLTGCSIGSEGVRAALDSSILSRVTALGLDFETDLPALARSPRLRRFTELAFYPDAMDETSDADWRDLARTLGERPALRSLTLEMSNLPSASLRHLLGSPAMAGLRRLRLQSVYEATLFPWDKVMTPAAFPDLAELELEGCRFRSLRWLAEWPGLARLRSLVFGNMDRLDDLVQPLLLSPHFGTNLAALSLPNGDHDEPLTLDTLLALARCERLGRLLDLRFDWEDIPAEAVAAFAESAFARRLTKLQITGHANSVIEAGLLAHPAFLPRLRELCICRLPEVTPPEQLRERFGPRLRLFHP